MNVTVEIVGGAWDGTKGMANEASLMRSYAIGETFSIEEIDGRGRITICTKMDISSDRYAVAREKVEAGVLSGYRWSIRKVRNGARRSR